MDLTTTETFTTDMMEDILTTSTTLSVNVSDVPDISPTPIPDVMCSKVVTMTTIPMLGLAIVINCITLAMVSCDPKKRNTRSNIYAASFFIAEIFYALNTLVAHYHRYFLSSPEQYENVIAHGYLFMEFASRGAMAISLGGVLIDRYRAIFNVTSYCPRQSLCVSCCYALASWLLALLLAVPFLAGLTDYWYSTYHSLRPFDVYTGVHTAIVYFLPLLVFSLAYNILMCRLISCSSRQSLDSFAAKGNHRQRATRRNLATVMIVTVIAFVFTWLLYLSVRVIEGYFKPEDFQPINIAALRLAGNYVAYLGLSVCSVLVCVLCGDYKSLDSHRGCSCCSDNQNFVTKIEQAWPSAKPNSYYV